VELFANKKDKLFKLAGPDEECYHISSLVNGIVNPPMPASTADTEESYHHFWDTVIEEWLKFFFEGSWIAEQNNAGERSFSGTMPDKVVRFGFLFHALWRGEEKGPLTLYIPGLFWQSLVSGKGHMLPCYFE
jgi:hypothetical protein